MHTYTLYMSLSITLTLYFETTSLTELGAHLLARLTGQKNLGILSSPPHWHWGRGHASLCLAFHVGVCGSGSHAYRGLALSTEPSLQLCLYKRLTEVGEDFLFFQL